MATDERLRREGFDLDRAWRGGELRPGYSRLASPLTDAGRRHGIDKDQPAKGRPGRPRKAREADAW